MASTKILLQKLGFTQNEASVYDFLLKQGSATVQEIYKGLSMNRVTVYEILKRFLHRGFVSKSKRVGKDLFILESPDRLKDLISEKKLNIKRLQNEVKELLASAIDELPEKEKLVIVLYYYENLTLREIGEILNVSESRVCQIHTKVILRLRSLLTKKAGELTLEA